MRRLLSSRLSRLEWRDVAFRRQRRHRQTNTIVYIVASVRCVRACLLVSVFQRVPFLARSQTGSSDRSRFGVISIGFELEFLWRI